MTTTIRRYVETDTGHRVPNHKSNAATCTGTAIDLKQRLRAMSSPFRGL